MTVIFASALFLLLICPVRAANAEIYDETGAADNFDLLDEETKRILSSVGADLSDPSSVTEISPSRVLHTALTLFIDGFGNAGAQLSLLIGMILLFAVVSQFLPQHETGGAITVITMFGFAAVELPVVTDLVRSVLSAVETVSVFVKTMIPWMGVIVASAGAPASSAALTGAAVGCAQVVTAAVDYLFVPLTGSYGAIVLSGAADDMFSLDRCARLFKKVFVICLGGAALIFVGVLSLRGVAARAADSLAFKGAKFLIGGLVPVVGGAMSDGLSTMTASLNAVNDAVGALGIAAIGILILPPLLKVLTHRAVLWCASLAGELAGLERGQSFLSGISELLSMLNILLLFDGFVFICALGLLIGAS